MKYCFAICLCSLVLATGCKGTVEVNCNDEPNDSACRELCVTEPMLSHCSATDGGIDSGTDGAVDGGPDAASPCPTECTGATPVCNETTMECVQCVVPLDCESMGDNAMCSDGSCVECMTNADCSEPGESVCSTDEGTAGTCVGCSAGNAMDCMGVLGAGDVALNVCDESGESPVCVRCNASDESACVDNVCDVLAKTCTEDTAMGSAEVCEACVSDRQCEDGLACIPVGEEPRDYYCMQDNGDGCTEPFTVRLMARTSIGDLPEANYCGINETLASCENVRSLLDNVTCPGGEDEECPEGGLCRRVGDLLNRCTYECAREAECDTAPGPGSSCGNATDPEMGVDFCGGDPG